MAQLFQPIAQGAQGLRHPEKIPARELDPEPVPYCLLLSCSKQTRLSLQIEQEGVTVKGTPHFNPDPDAETLYKAMKGIGEWACATWTLWGCASCGRTCSPKVGERAGRQWPSPT